jgi:hypothetical protein
MAHLNLIQNKQGYLKNKEQVLFIIEQQYSYVTSHIPKWLSVMEVERERLDFEQKVTMQNGIVIKDEIIDWGYSYNSPWVTREVTEFKSKSCVVQRRFKFLDDVSIGYDSFTEEEFWKHYTSPHYSTDIELFSKTNQNTISEYISDNGVRKLRSYEYKFDKFGNWTECLISDNGKIKVLAIREYKYK